ncbi:hypothetical protein JAO29_00790 [Edaphobacter sp. HDX4]|uniref:hypothetical protein n=1 Tax=Edaphobacter sp. HDX4 TaxID=2794064 RepID=UPI002FE6B552
MKKFRFVILALVATAGAIGDAQTLHVRLLNGSSGKPISNTYVNVWVGNQRKEALSIPIDSSGNGVLRLTGGAADEGLQAESAHSPTFPFAPEIKVQAGFVLCQVKQQKYSWLHITPYSTEDWVRTGIVTANTCGKAVAKPEPGILTIFVRPLRFWEKLSE